MKSLVVIVGLLVAAVQAAPGERFSGGPTPLNVYMPLIEGAPKVQAPKIVNGFPASEGQFPYQAAIIIDGGNFCGGSLISPYHVLTAAHCAQGISFQIILGRLRWNGVGGLSIMTSNKVIHASYNPSTLANDIALLRFPSAIEYTSTIQPVVLTTPDDNFDTFEGDIADVSGYGSTSDTGGVSPNLMWVNVHVITNALCAQTFGSLILASHICTSGAGGSGTCNGDSGGPLTVLVSGSPRLIGVVSFWSSAGCAAGHPTVHSRVTYFRPWICSNTAGQIC